MARRGRSGSRDSARAASTGRTRIAGLLLASLAAAFVLPGTVLTAAPTPAFAVAGVPGAPTVVYSEDFEAGSPVSPILRLNQYVGAGGQMYTADPAWLASCNGWVAAAVQSVSSPAQVADCNGVQRAWNNTQQLSTSIGTFHGLTAAQAAANHGVSALSLAVSTPAGSVEFATQSNIPLPTAARFLAFSVDVAAESCTLAHPLLQFSLVNPAGQALPVGGQIDGCSSPTQVSVPAVGAAPAVTATVGTYTTNGAVLFSGSSVGIRLVNNQPNGNGNDHGFDNIQILDATPALDKSFGAPDPLTGASRVTFTVTNTSELGAKQGFSATDALPPGLVVANPSQTSTTCTNGAMSAAVGGSSIALSGDLVTGQTSCVFSATVVPAALTAPGSPPQVFQNCAANFTTLVGLDAPTACATLTVPPPATLAVGKSTTATAATRSGDTIRATVTVQNTGGSAYTASTPATMTDDLAALADDATYDNDATVAFDQGSTSAPPVVNGTTLSWSGPLKVGETATISYTLTVTLAGDGILTNTACVPAGQATGPPCATVSTPVVLAPALVLTKTADTSGIGDPVQAGNPIAYQYTLTNAGNVTLTAATIGDPLPGLSAPAYTWPGPPGTLQPGQTATATATYAVTESDILAGHRDNTATATASSPQGLSVDAPPASTSTVLVQVPALALTKTVDTSGLSSPPRAGDTLTYRFTATNTGNLPLTGVTITDPLPGLTPLIFTWPGTPGALAPGETVTAVAAYAITQSDLDAVVRDNTATATGDRPTGPAVDSAPATTLTMLDAAPALDLTKTADTTGLPVPPRPGDELGYRYAATNTGNVTLTGVTITDPLVGLSPLVYVWPGAPGMLEPGQTVTATATYPLAAADLDAGHRDNTATATGDPPSGVVVTATASVNVPLAAAPGVALAKSADTSQLSTPVRVGDTLIYLYTATNTGNVTLSGVTITDPLPGLSPLVFLWPGATGVLAAGQSVTATATYTLTQTDLDAGVRDNTATTTGDPPTGSSVTATASVSTPLAASPTLSLTKSADSTGLSSPPRAGDQVTYHFGLTNTGNVTLTGVTVSDALAGLSTPTYSWPGLPGILQPGESATATADYSITATDLAAGRLRNAAIATAMTPAGATIASPPAAVTIDLPQPAPIPPQSSAAADASALPSTGSDLTDGTVAALLLIALGAALARRSPQRHSRPRPHNR
ncbi:hypothetical protein [Leifsonia sp. LS-T14]|uniref:DUF7507 domain-containing protein n=1 Tax=unclassified Leifsonia TaxID=2663824 RepID=UPI0035A60E3B